MGRLGHRFELLVLDEVHHFGCNLGDEALEMSIAAAGSVSRRPHRRADCVLDMNVDMAVPQPSGAAVDDY
jgi:hypothetical protein